MDRQGHSGLGLEVQRAKVKVMASERGALIVSEFVEDESGRKNDPPFAAALAQTRAEKGVWLVTLAFSWSSPPMRLRRT